MNATDVNAYRDVDWLNAYGDNDSLSCDANAYRDIDWLKIVM